MTRITIDGSSSASPQTWARIGGALYLVIIVVGVFGQLFVRGRLVVPGDAMATAERIRSSERLWRVGIAGELFLLLTCGVVLTLIFYLLLRPVSRELTLLAVFFNLLAIGIEAANKVHLHEALFPLNEAGSPGGFTAEQLSTLTAFAVRSESQGFGISLIFFGWECVVLGYLIYRSGYLPRLIGVLMAIAGLSYLANSLALIVAPSFQSRLLPFILIPAFVGEMSFCLWLLVKGVDVPKWEERARA